MADTEQKSTPNLLYLILALLGLSTVQNLGGNGGDSAGGKGDKGANKSAAAIRPATKPVDEAQDTNQAILKPLIDHFSTDEDDRNVLKSIKEKIDRDPIRGLQFLIVTVPDPVRSTNSHRFDEWVGAVQRACESENYVLERSRIPWGDGAGPSATDQGHVATPTENPVAGAGSVARPASTGKQPGLFLFRGVDPVNGQAPLLAVFLVPETPTLGVNKDALDASLTLAKEWDVRNRDQARAACEFDIVGPSFSGSKGSMQEVLSSWCRKNHDKDNQFRVISGSVTAMTELTLKVAPRAGRRNQVDFHTTVRGQEELLRAVFDHIGDAEDTAMLIEANTGFGRKVLYTNASKGKVISYPFPLHISKLRESYEQKGLLHDKESQTLHSAENLTIPFDEAGEAADIPETRTPGFTAAVAELALNQIIADIGRRKIRRVGISVTDPLDVVFLARKVRQFCPDVLLFTTQSHILFTHPQHVAEMRGMLVASTYPLFPQNQLWSYSYRGETTNISFPGDSVQGTYNAVIAQLDGDGRRGIRGDDQVAPRYLEYGAPFDPAPIIWRGARRYWANRPRTPPVWLSAVGNHGLYPVKVVVRREGKDSAYLFAHLAKERPAAVASQVQNWFRPQFPVFWTFLFFCLTIGCLVLTGVNAMVYWWAASGFVGTDRESFNIMGLPTVRLAQFLNCCRADYAARQSCCRGPGLYPAIAHVLLLTVYVTATWPLLSVMLLVPWYPLQVHDLGFWLAGVAYAVNWLSAVAIVLSVLAWCITTRRLWGAESPRFGAREGPCRRLLKRMRIAEGRRSPPPAPPPGGLFRVLRALLVRADSARRVAVRRFVALVRAVPAQPITTYRRQVVALVWVAVAIPAALILFAALLSLVHDPLTLHNRFSRDALVQLARGLAVPSGVSPVLAMVFLSVSGCAWAHAQLKRRFVFDQFTPEVPWHDTRVKPGEIGEEKILREVRERRQRFENILSAPIRTFFQTRNLFPLIVLLLSVGYFVLPLPTRSVLGRGKSYDGVWFDTTASLVFASLFALLTFHLLQLVMLWWDAQGLLKHLVRLPLVSALDRMPARVAHWFHERPGPEADRFDVLQRQALALAGVCEQDGSAVRFELQDTLDRAFGPEESWEWVELVVGLKTMQRDTYGAVRDRLVRILLVYWRPLPVATVYPDAAGVGKPAGPGAAGPGKLLPDWAQLAEDLLALMFMRWLAAALAQVWVLIGFLVVGSVSLLLAVNSYPFPYQERLMLGLGLLIGALVVTILTIVLGFNRDELISRIANTAPNQMKLNQHLVGGVLTYIVPLVGVLAAFSFDTSDTLRSLLDPILRHLR